jgi:hypothetical protein
MLPKNVASFWHVPLTTMQLLHLKFSSKVLQGKLKRVYFLNSKRENERKQKRYLISTHKKAIFISLAAEETPYVPSGVVEGKIPICNVTHTHNANKYFSSVQCSPKQWQLLNPVYENGSVKEHFLFLACVEQ